MRLRSLVRNLGLAFVLSGLLTITPLSAVVQMFFDGGGSGATADGAVRRAIWDAEVSASAYGLYRCELADEPIIFPQPANSLRAFRAQVTVYCE
jgi:hypothetical protein